MTEYFVKLTYFKASGKYYSSASYLTKKEHLHEIWQEISYMQQIGKLPGLIEGARMPLIWVKVPQHPNRHPHLVVDLEMRST